HLHHRLMRLGHGQRRSVLILWVWTALLSGFVLYPAYTDQGNAVVPFGVAALGVALYTLLHPEARRVRARGAEQLALGLDPEPEPEEPLTPPATRSASGTGRRH
ncbi:MAG: undecaprenyl/decaprenyl-phosphate alpha-N-acetylglucosaminyl 1-phosphate transferase, partial [Actinomycetota bacterium]|nr:undecaprenyl/decaprenyl-phosphate alpha-N-acetylglucosaminyl 1-phosphate transferase [Actinomycetota bacterium]